MPPGGNGHGGGWIRINLGHVLTILTVIVGFVVSVQQAKDQVGSVATDVLDMKKSILAIQLSLQANQISMTTLRDDVTALQKDTDRIDRHFDATDARVAAEEKLTQALESEMKIINDSLQLQSQVKKR